tara:strand:+ start:3045 stop:7805 length:4761 start_codon:yes stop_codon:yes gene_type:complete
MAIFKDDNPEENISYGVTTPTLSETAIPTGEKAWLNDPRIQKAAEIYLDDLSKNNNVLDSGAYFDGNKDIREVLRDEDYRLETMIARQGNVDNMSPQARKAYTLLRTTWEDVEVEDYLGATKDIVTDLLASPISLLGLVFTGGTGNAAVQTAGKAGLKKTLKNFAVSDSTSAQAIKGAMVGGVYEGSYEDQAQRFEIGTGLADDYDIKRTATGLGIGVAGGAALAGLVGGTSKLLKNRGKERVASSESSEKLNEGVRDPIDPEIFEAVDDNIETIIPSRSTSVSTEVDIDSPFSVVIDQEPVEVFAEAVNKKYGGGERTREEMVDGVNQVIRDNPDMPLKNFKNRIGFELGRITNKLGSKLIFKPVSVIESFSDYSDTAKELMKKFRYDAGRTIRGERGYDAQDFNEVYKETAGRYHDRSARAMEPLSLNMKGKLGDLANDSLLKSLRGGEPESEGITTISTELRGVLNDIGDRLFEAGFIQDKVNDYVPRMWNRSAINKNQEAFAQKLKDSGEVNSFEEGMTVVGNMLDKKNESQFDGGAGGNGFFFKRKFDKLQDSDFEEFLNNDVVDIMNTYIFQSSKQLAKQQVFGVKNLKGYKTKYVDTIRAEMRAAGKTLTESDEKDLLRVYKLTTGEDVGRFESATVQGAVDAYSLANRLAYLPLATLSSVTEIFINVAKAGPVKSLKGFRDARSVAQETIQKTLQEKLGKEGLTQPEIWREMNKFGLALDTSMSDMAERLSGEALNTKWARQINNGFFRFNLLDQWTKSVQMMSYTTGKTLIRDNLAAISKNKGLPDSSRIKRFKDELKELNVNIEDGLQWLDAGAKQQDPFEETIQRGAARYANEIILNPTTESGLKPTLMANPQTSILFQFMGYPAAFTNTVLKNAASSLLRSPTQNGPRILGAGILMTEMARWANYARSGGESERFKDDEEIYTNAIVRWGGNGLAFDMMERGKKSAEVYQSPVAFAAGVMGPVGQDAYSLAARGDIVNFLGKKVPLYGAGRTIENTFGVEFMDAYNDKLKELGKELKKTVVPERPDKPFLYNKGGEVLDVPNVPPEPDERIDKVTGQPYNKQAGTAFIDREDGLARLGFKSGGSVDPLTRLGFSAGSKVGKAVVNLADMAFEEIITAFSPRKISSEDAAAAVRAIDEDIGFMDDEVENFVKLTMRTQLEKKRDLSKAETKERFPEFVDDDNVLQGGAEFSRARGYDPEAIKAYEAQKEAAEDLYMEGTDFTETIESDVTKALDGIKARDVTSTELKDEAFFDTRAEYSRIENAIKDPDYDPREYIDSGTDLFLVEEEVSLLKTATDSESLRTKEMYDDLLKKMPDTRLPETPIKANPDRKANLEEALEESEVKVPVYRTTAHGLDTDYEINYAFPKELGPHYGTLEQADDLAIRDHFNYEPLYSENFNVKPSELYIGDNKQPEKAVATVKGYLLLRKPLLMSTDTGTFNATSLSPRTLIEDMSEQLSKGEKKFKANLVSSMKEKYFQNVTPKLDEFNAFEKDVAAQAMPNFQLQLDIRQAYVNRAMKDFIQSYGFDSVKYKNKFEGNKEDFSYISFEPNQFKITTASDFNFEDSRVYKNSGGVS